MAQGLRRRRQRRVNELVGARRRHGDIVDTLSVDRLWTFCPATPRDAVQPCPTAHRTGQACTGGSLAVLTLALEALRL